MTGPRQPMPPDPPTGSTSDESATGTPTRTRGAEDTPGTDATPVLADRVRALERAVSDHGDPPAPLPELADLTSTQADIADRLAALETRVADVAGRQQAVEAYVDHLDHVNESVERRAEAALAAVDRLERSQGGVVDHPEEAAGTAPMDGPAGQTPSDQRAVTATTTDTGSNECAEDGPVDDAPASPAVPDAASRSIPDAAAVSGPPDDESDAEDSRGFVARLLGR